MTINMLYQLGLINDDTVIDIVSVELAESVYKGCFNDATVSLYAGRVLNNFSWYINNTVFAYLK